MTAETGPVAAVMEVLDVHRWKTIGVDSVACECGEVVVGDGSLNQFPADEAFRQHVAEAAVAALADRAATDATTAVKAALDEVVERLEDTREALEGTNPLTDLAEGVRTGGLAALDDALSIVRAVRDTTEPEEQQP